MAARNAENAIRNCAAAGQIGEDYVQYADDLRDAVQRLSQQLAAAGEEIMVNTPYDVFTLPLQPSGLSSGPRFVVHVPGPEQPAGVEGMQRRLDREESDHGRTIDQRDAAEDALGRMFQAVTGQTAEWSSAWGYVDAIEEVEEHVATLAAERDQLAAALEAAREDAEPVVRFNDDGTLDEVVGRGQFHLEQMGSGHWWMQLGPHIVNLSARGKIRAHFGRNEAAIDAAMEGEK